jgi:hypothetical protein
VFAWQPTKSSFDHWHQPWFAARQLHSGGVDMREVLTVSAMLCATVAAADPVPMTAGEIEALLGGNTALGDWQGDIYRQYFATDGATIYAVEGRRSSRGRWRVVDETDAYESWWPGSGWDAYAVLRNGDAMIWMDAQGVQFGFEVVEGQQLLFAATN